MRLVSELSDQDNGSICGPGADPDDVAELAERFHPAELRNISRSLSNHIRALKPRDVPFYVIAFKSGAQGPAQMELVYQDVAALPRHVEGSQKRSYRVNASS